MRYSTAVLSALLGLMVSSCGKKEAVPPPTPPVSFATATKENTPYTIETFGNCVTIASVTLQAQVTGNLLKYAIKQGDPVKKNDLVAQIDPAPFQAAVEQAQGALDTAQAKLDNANVTLQRDKQLYATKTIDLADLQTAEANYLSAQGDVLSNQANLQTAQINLGYCTINSPIDGKTGAYIVDAGNLVTANNTQLINIQTMSPIYVDFTISENDFSKVREYFDQSGGNGLDANVSIPGLPGRIFPGKLTFINNAISNSTGTLMLRATMPNPDGALWPGLYVNVELVLTVMDSVVIPVQCVLVGQTGPYIFVVRPDNTVEQRSITVGERHGDMIVVSAGVNPGDRVVTAGQLGLATGKKVVPQPYQPPLPPVNPNAIPAVTGTPASSPTSK